MTDGTTERLAHFTRQTAFSELPADVQDAGVRAFVNWIGCTLGGCNHPATTIAREVSAEFSGSPVATLIGTGGKSDALDAAYINCLASAAHAYDDTHLATVIHPTGPVAGAVFALAERHATRGNRVSGTDLVAALVVGIEVSCQLGVALLLPPAEGQLGWYMTGVAGCLGAAAAAAKVLGLNHEQTCWALGLAGNQASGFRQTHGSMCTSFVPGHAARCGLHAAVMAAHGMTASLQAIEGENGFARVFSHHADLASIDQRLGQHWEIRDNALKPYPCGIVIHPVIDACLALRGQLQCPVGEIDRIDIEVNPLCLTLCDRPAPQSDQDGQVSVQHWTAASLLRGRAGLAEGRAECVTDPDVVDLRTRVHAVPDEQLGREAARVTITGPDGMRRTETVQHAVGSLQRPMTEVELKAKFMEQAEPILGAESSARLLEACQQVVVSADVSALGPMAGPLR